MKKVLFSLLFAALSTLTFAQQWTSISKSSVNAEPAGPEVTLISSSEKQVVVDFSIGGFYLTSVSTPNGTQQIVSVPKMAPMLTAGAPDLPQFPVPAIIGDLAEMEVSILKSEFTDYQNVEIAPSKGNLSRQVDPKNVPYTYGPMYSQDAFYPEAQASLDAPYILRDFRGQNIMVKPFTYNPTTKTLRVYHNLTIAMRKVSDNGENPKLNRKRSGKLDPEMRQVYSHRFINFGENAAKYNFVNDRGEMLVICADQFMDGMQEFIAWKNQSGRPTFMVSMTEVGGNEQNAIKNYITNIYNDPTHNLQFVLFVGDYEHITPHPFISGYSNEYSDNWFGQVEGTDHYEEVIIGRFSVQNATHLANQVNKVLYYERDMPEALTWVNKGLGIGAIGAGSGHYGEDDYQHIDFIRDTLEHYTYEHVTELHEGGGASASAISNTINNGVSIINYCNHGSETSWAVANYSNNHVNALTNDYKWPIVWSVACLCGKFNYGGANGECFAEAWMRASNNSTGVPTGAIGGMFSWMSQPWIPPMYGQDEMVDILTEWHNNDKYNHTLGGASINGNMYVIDMSGSQGYDTHDTWILFGDPTVMVRTDNPVPMNVTCSPSALMLGMTEMEVDAENTAFGIATMMMDGEVISSGYILDGTCTLHFAPLSNVGTATLTVMGYNKVTEILPLEVLPAEGPYITLTNSVPNFAPVNVETDMSMTFKNVGVDPTNGPVNVTVSCANESLNFTHSTATFDVLGADETITLENAFSFIVSQGVEDGTRFQIDVTMADNSHSWTGKTFVTAGQANFNYVGTDWSGSFVPGESLTMIAKFQNNGHYMATNAIANITCDNPYVHILNESYEIGTIDPEGIASCPFQITIDAECPSTEQITIGFTMQADGDLTAEGSIVLKNSCAVIVEMHDSWGDGWNGNILKLSFSDGSPDIELSVPSGSHDETRIVEIGSGVHVVLTWITGQYSYECSFTIKYESGETIYTSGSLSGGGVLHEFDCNCTGGDTPITDFAPVENLVADVDGSVVVLTWDAPEGAIAYTILRNGIEIGQTTEPTYSEETSLSVNYTYCVVAEYADGSSIPECVIVNLTVIEENVDHFSLYPNPASNILYIEGGNSEFTYEMFNGMGQMVVTGKAQGSEQISIEGLTKGIYFIRLTNGTQVHMEKVVVR